MIILLSPTKTFTNNLIISENNIKFSNKTNELLNILFKYSKDDLKNNLKLSEKLSNDVYEFYSNYKEEYTSSYLYGGTSFKYLDANSINKDKLNNLYILSALYGINNGLTKISKYRLDIKDKINNINLYNYWYDTLNEYISNNFSNKIIINLASKEYYKMIDTNIENIYTIELISTNKKLSSMELKKYRGLFARHILINEFNSIDQIKKIEIDDFKFKDELKQNILVFERSYL